MHAADHRKTVECHGEIGPIAAGDGNETLFAAG